MSDFPPLPSRCWAQIDCDALRHNVAVCRELAGDGCDVMAIVKADAYGHGLEKTGKILSDAGISWFGVANVQEAIRLAGEISDFSGILVLSATFGNWERKAIVENEFSAAVSSLGEVAAFSDIAQTLGKTARLHAVVDTGMGRMGVEKSAFGEFVDVISNSEAVALEGVATHFPSADEDADFTVRQIAEFAEIMAPIEFPPDCKFHLANSAGAIGFQKKIERSHLIRPGLAIYGISPLSVIQTDLKPVLSLTTRVALVRELPAGASVSYGRTYITEKPTRVATLAVGYGDGYPRHLSDSQTDVLIGGRRCRMLGRVTMDQIVVDVSDLPENDVYAGAPAVLIGTQGEETITAVELAEKAGTIPWEILTGLTNRVERVYL